MRDVWWCAVCDGCGGCGGWCTEGRAKEVKCHFTLGWYVIIFRFPSSFFFLRALTG
jgi:hypothetical protein